MSSKLRSANIIKTNADSFPSTSNVDLKDAISVNISVTGANSVAYKFTNTGETGIIEPGKNYIVNTANSDSITDKIVFTFNGAATVLVEWIDGISGSAAGGATAANQVIMINYLNGTTPSVLSGNSETPSIIEYLANGMTDTCLSCSILFEGSNGKLNGVTVKNGFIASFSGTFRNQVIGISFDVPTIADAYGNKRVLVTYTKI